MDLMSRTRHDVAIVKASKSPLIAVTSAYVYPVSLDYATRRFMTAIPAFCIEK